MATQNLHDRLYVLMQNTTDVETSCALNQICAELNALQVAVGQTAPLPWSAKMQASIDFAEFDYPAIMSGDSYVCGDNGFFLMDGTDEANAKLCVEAVNLLFG